MITHSFINKLKSYCGTIDRTKENLKNIKLTIYIYGM